MDLKEYLLNNFKNMLDGQKTLPCKFYRIEEKNDECVCVRTVRQINSKEATEFDYHGPMRLLGEFAKAGEITHQEFQKAFCEITEQHALTCSKNEIFGLNICFEALVYGKVNMTRKTVENFKVLNDICNEVRLMSPFSKFKLEKTLKLTKR